MCLPAGRPPQRSRRPASGRRAARMARIVHTVLSPPPRAAARAPAPPRGRPRARAPTPPRAFSNLFFECFPCKPSCSLEFNYFSMPVGSGNVKLAGAALGLDITYIHTCIHTYIHTYIDWCLPNNSKSPWPEVTLEFSMFVKNDTNHHLHIYIYICIQPNVRI